ncbi:MAG: PhoX family phosphatase [Spirulina sp. SIO3F2]|nr:PhoX family phosphatase [Spirulina sp. SIO3F2]
MSAHQFNQPPIDPDNIDYNASSNDSFWHVIEQAKVRRRGFLKGSSSLVAASMLGAGLAFLGEAVQSKDEKLATAASGLELSFGAVAKDTNDQVTVPTGYTATILIATGDPISSQVSAYKNDGTDTSFEFRAGDHHDGMHFFGLGNSGRDPNSASKGLLCINHEVAEDLGFMHANGPTDYGNNNTNARPTSEIDKEVQAHGVSVVEVVKTGNTYQINKNSRYNRRINAATPMEITGPARGSAMLVTAYAPQGDQTRGTINNCANGYTPWGTYLTCEENWPNYFYRREAEGSRTTEEETAFKRYGIKPNTSGRYNWSRSGANDVTDLYRRWNTGKTADRPDRDFRNVANTFGWVVEIDPFDPTSVPRKRTALGRLRHEGCWPAPAVAGRPIVFYTGDDARNEYIYKYVSNRPWDAADANKGMAVGDKYLNEGKLYAAKFNDDGTGEWLLLSLSNPDVANYEDYTFTDDVDVAIHSRLAADAAGATKMDRPEWGAVNPTNGDVYFALTNSVSGSSGRGMKTPLDAANPRFYADAKGEKIKAGNVNGHIIRWREADSNHASTRFEWDIYLFGAQADADANLNVSGLSDDNDFSSPDGAWFSQASPGLMWIQTDDSAYTDQSNCMMLAALPGTVGDGTVKAIDSQAVPAHDGANHTVTTKVGQAANSATLRRFLVGPKDCEITGIAETPDGKAIFVNIQHPGERSKSPTNPAQFTSHWPDGGDARPRSATIVITRDDGSLVAL